MWQRATAAAALLWRKSGTPSSKVRLGATATAALTAASVSCGMSHGGFVRPARLETIKRDLTPLVICGPSGVGKGSIIAELQKRHPGVFGFAVSHTSRKPRPGEVNGREYHFSTREDMLALIERGEFLEHANVHKNIYGTSRGAVKKVLDEGRICILDIDVQGATIVRENNALPGTKFLFVRPPMMEELEVRLRGRGTETEEKIQLRLNNAIGELEAASRPGLFDKDVVNSDLEACVVALEAILKEWYGSISWSSPTADGRP